MSFFFVFFLFFFFEREREDCGEDCGVGGFFFVGILVLKWEGRGEE